MKRSYIPIGYGQNNSAMISGDKSDMILSGDMSVGDNGSQAGTKSANASAALVDSA